MSGTTVDGATTDATGVVDPDDAGGTLPPVGTLELIAHDTRRGIIEALWAAEDAPVAFSTLRERVGVESSPRFDYHLQALVGAGVRAGKGGYELSDRGERFVRALSAVPSMDPPGDDPRSSGG